MIPSAWRASLTKIIFIGIITFHFLSAFSYLDYPVTNGETHRDYLVARRMVDEGQISLAGPGNGIFRGMKSSPFYYYTLAAVLRVNDNLLFLSSVNIFLQSATLVIFYYLAKLLFGSGVGLITMGLMAVSSMFFNQTYVPWPPHIMQPFINMSYLTLAFAWQKNNYKALLISVVYFLFATAMYLAAFGAAPFFLMTSSLVLYRQRKRLSKSILFLCIVILGILILYGPLGFYLIQNVSSSTPVLSNVFITTPLEFFKNVYVNGTILKSGAFLMRTYSVDFIALSLVWTGGMGYLFAHKEKRAATLFILLNVLGFIIVTGFFAGSLKYPHRFTPVFGTSMILLAAGIYYGAIKGVNIFSMVPKKMRIVIGGILLLFCIGILARDLRIDRNTLIAKDRFYYFNKIDTITNAIVQEVWAIQKKKNYPDSKFFDIEVYKKTYASKPNETFIFWIPIEQKLQTVFIQVDHTSGNNLLIPRDASHRFLICNGLFETIDERECLRSSDESYRVVKHIATSEPFSVYLLENTK